MCTVSESCGVHAAVPPPPPIGDVVLFACNVRGPHTSQGLSKLHPLSNSGRIGCWARGALLGEVLGGRIVDSSDTLAGGQPKLPAVTQPAVLDQRSLHRRSLYRRLRNDCCAPGVTPECRDHRRSHGLASPGHWEW